jgi:hypothetical protein
VRFPANSTSNGCVTASCSGEEGVGVGRVAAPGHVPFEDVREGDGKAVVAGGGR